MVSKSAIIYLGKLMSCNVGLPDMALEVLNGKNADRDVGDCGFDSHRGYEVPLR